MAKLRCPWCGQEQPKVTLADLEGLFQTRSPWREHKPRRCPYCDEIIAHIGGLGTAVIMLGIIVLASLLTLPLGYRSMSLSQILMTVAGSLLLIIVGVYVGRLPYQRGEGPQYPVTGGTVRMERLTKRRPFSQWRGGMVQPVFFVDEAGRPVSEGVCAIFTHLHREKGNTYTARMELVPYHTPCEFPEKGERFFLFIQGKKSAQGQIIESQPKTPHS